MSEYQILSIEAWRDSEGGWTWNQWYARGTLTAADLDKCAPGGRVDTRKLLTALRAEGLDIPSGMVAVDDDQHNYVVVQKNTREPLYAVCYGEPLDRWTVLVGNVGTVYTGTDESEARRLYADWVDYSGNDAMRAYGETVTLMRGDDIACEHVPDGREDDDRAEAQAEGLKLLAEAGEACPEWASADQWRAACVAAGVQPEAQHVPALDWGAPIPMSAEDLQRSIISGKARIVGSQRARVLRKRGEVIRYAYDTATGKRRFLWTMAPKVQA